MEKVLISIIICIASFVVSVGAQDIAPISETIDRTFALDAGGEIVFDNVNGELKIEGWTQNEVRVVAQKRVEGCRVQRDIQIQFDSTPQKLSINNIYDEGKAKGWNNYCRTMYVNYTLYVPRTARLSDISTVNGSITATGTFPQFNASTVNGSINAKNLGGEATLETVNGSIAADFALLSSLKADTVNGSVRLLFPPSLDAKLDLSTVNGSIKSAFALPNMNDDERSSGKQVRAVVGKGTAVVNVETVNGSISLLDREQGANQTLTVVPSANQKQILMVERNTPVAPDVRNARKGGFGFNLDFDFSALNNIDIATSAIEMALKSIELTERNLRSRLSGEKLEEALKEVATARKELREALNNSRTNSVFNSQVKKTETFGNNGTVEIKGGNSVIIVRGWEREEISYQLTYSGKETSGDAVKAEINGNKAEINISPALGANRLMVYVPRKSNLKIVSQGDIRLENVEGKLEIDGVKNRVEIFDGSGSLNLTTDGGNVRLVGFKGTVETTARRAKLNVDGDMTQMILDMTDSQAVLTLAPDASVSFDASRAITVEGFTAQNAANNRQQIGGGANTLQINPQGTSRVTIRNRNLIKSTP